MTSRVRIIALGGWFGIAALTGPSRASGQDPDWAAVQAALGRAGQVQAAGVYRVGMPRTDLSVTVRGIAIRPALSLGSWVGFKPAGDGSVVMTGDLVLTDAELNPVVSRLQQGGVGQTAIHKHLPDHSPALWWAHIAARGNAVELATTVREALALSKTPMPPSTPVPEPAFALDTTALRQALGRSGRVSGGVYQVSVSRAETIRFMGIDVPASMGVGTVINFQPSGDGNAVVNGDFVMIGTEVDSVVKTLRANRIDVVEIHNHLVNEDPRLYFVHFFAQDDAAALARGLRAALDRTNVR